MTQSAVKILIVRKREIIRFKHVSKKNKVKKQKKNRKIMKDRTQIIPKPQVSNNKSHLMVQKYSNFVEFELLINKKEDELIEIEKELIETVSALGIVNSDGKCFQKQRWVNPFDSDVTVDFVAGQRSICVI